MYASKETSLTTDYHFSEPLIFRIFDSSLFAFIFSSDSGFFLRLILSSQIHYLISSLSHPISFTSSRTLHLHHLISNTSTTSLQHHHLISLYLICITSSHHSISITSSRTPHLIISTPSPHLNHLNSVTLFQSPHLIIPSPFPPPFFSSATLNDLPENGGKNSIHQKKKKNHITVWCKRSQKEKSQDHRKETRSLQTNVL